MSFDRTCPQCAAPLAGDAPEGSLCPACSQSAGAQTRIMHPARTVLETIGDYEVIDKLGQGGMGAVYRARQVSLDRIVALKLLPQDATQDPEAVSRFEREAKVAAQLAHPNLVRVLTNGHASGSYFIAMELVEGENLSQRLKRGAMTPVEAVRICLGVARGLQCGWQTTQLIHRDIKPGNIYLATNGDVKLGDLGLAKSTLGNTTGLTQTGTMMGTPHYISPEQARADKNLDFRADIYSLGCTLYQCLTGRTPYEADDALTLMSLHRDAPPPAILKVMPQCPIPLARLVGRMLKKGKHERHASYDDLIADLENVMDLLVHGDASAGRAAAAWKQLKEEPILSLPKAATPRPAETATTSKSKLPLYGAITASVLVVAGLVWWLVPGKPKPVARVAPPAKNTPSSAPDASSAGWQPLIRGEAKWRSADGSSFQELKDGLLHLHNAEPNGVQPSADGAIRVRIRFLEGTKNLIIFLRSVGDVGRYLVGFNKTAVELQRVPLPQPAAGRSEVLGKFTLPKPLAVGDTLDIELRAQGPRLTVLVNGTTAIEADDAKLTAPGRWGVYAFDGWFESVEVQSLPAAATPRFSPSTEPWQDRMADIPASSVTREGAALRIKGNPKPTFPTASADGAIRVLVVPSAESLDNKNTSLVIRDGKPKTNEWYQFTTGATNAGILAYDDNKPRALCPRVNYASEGVMVPGKPVELELRAVGTRITASINGKVVASADDPALTSGSCGVHFPAGTLVHGLQTLDLSRAAAPAAAPTGWEPLLSDAEWKSSKTGREFTDGLLHLKVGIGQPQPTADAAIRARVRLRAGAQIGTIYLRSSVEEGKFHGYVHNEFPYAELVRTGPPGTPARGIRKKLPKPFSHDDTVQLELRAQGQHVTFLVNDAIVAEMDDPSVRGPGRWGIQSSDAWFESAEVQTLPASTPANGASSAAAQAGTIDLLPLVDVSRDAIKGKWSVKPEGLALDKPADFAVLELPYEPPEEYNLDVVFTPTTDGNNANIYLAAGGASFAWKLNAHGRNPPIYGFDLLDGKLMTARTEGIAQNPAGLVVGERCSTTVHVRRGSITGFFKNQQIMKWTGDFRRLSMEDGSRLRNPRALGIGSYKRGVIFHRVNVREMSGKGKVTAAVPGKEAAPRVPGEGGWKDLIAQIDPTRDAKNGQWKKENGTLVCAQTKQWALCEIPVDHPPDSYDLRVRITRGEGDPIGIFIPFRRGAAGGAIALDYFSMNHPGFTDGMKRAGLEGLREKGMLSADGAYTKRAQWLTKGQAATVLLQVRSDSMSASVDGTEIFRQQPMDWSQLQQGAGVVNNLFRPVAGRPIFGVGSFNCEAVFNSIELREVADAPK